MTEIENVQELIKIPDEINSAVERAVSETLKYEECAFEADVSVTIVDDERIREINKEHCLFPCLSLTKIKMP